MNTLKIGVLVLFAMCAAACVGSPAAPTKEGPVSTVHEAFIAEELGAGCSDYSGVGAGSTEGSALDAAFGDALTHFEDTRSCTLNEIVDEETDPGDECPGCILVVASFSCCS
jgi:hypothetical protein